MKNKRHIKSLLSVVLMMVFLFCTGLAVAFAAPEGKVPGVPFDYLQQQIDEIELTPGPAGPQGEQGIQGPKGDQGDPGPSNEGKVDVLLSATEYEDCLINEEGFRCEKKSNILVAVPTDTLAELDFVTVTTIQKDGEPTPLEETIKMKCLNRPKVDGPGNEIWCSMKKAGHATLEFTLAKEDPAYSIDQPGNGFSFRATLVTDSQVMISMNVDSIKQVCTESLGIIVSESNAYTTGDTSARLSVTIQNYGDMETDYLVTVTDFTNEMAEQVPVQSRTLEPIETATLVFDLHSKNGFNAGDSFMIRLKSPTGRLYDETSKEF